ncbi:MAG: flagellar export chaperone FliS [Sphingomonas sp.]|jgi:flagellar protein FliS
MQYATTLGRNPEATYRQIDIAGRTATANPHALVQLLYEEVVHALNVAALAAESGKYAMKSEKTTRALAILFALESGLDFERGGDLAQTLARLYRGARRTLVEASLGNDPAPFLNVANSLNEISQAWRTVGGA